MRSTAAGLLGLLSLATPTAALSQAFGGRATMLSARVTSEPPTGLLRFSGVAVGGEGTLVLKPGALTLRYFQGSIRDDSAGLERDLVEGEATVWLRPVRWAAVGLGPHARTFVDAGGSQRWLLWVARVRGALEMVGSDLVAYVEAATVLGASLDVPDGLDSGIALEGGLEVAVGRLPLALGVRYRVERLGLGNGTRTETNEFVALAAGIGQR